MDKAQAADWYAIKPKSIITVSDAQGIADSMRRGLGVRGIDYTVQSIARCNQLDGLSTHLLFTLGDSEQVTYLLVKIVDDLIDLFLFFEPPGLPSGGRGELLDRGLQWLFQAPPNPDNFELADLRYTMTIRQNVPGPDDKSPATELTYVMKSQGELQCKYTENPPRQGLPQEMLATLVEYRTDQPTDNPELLILEVGEERSTQSFVRFFLGCPIKQNEVDVLGV
jgi:hypothetical protein